MYKNTLSSEKHHQPAQTNEQGSSRGSEGLSSDDPQQDPNYVTSSEAAMSVERFVEELFLKEDAAAKLIKEEDQLIMQQTKKFGKTNFSLDIKYEENEIIVTDREELYSISRVSISRNQSRKQGHHVLAFGMYETFLQLKLLGIPVNHAIQRLLLSVEAINPKIAAALPRLRSEHKQEIVDSPSRGGLEFFQEICVSEIQKVMEQSPSQPCIDIVQETLRGTELTAADYNSFWRTYINGESARWLFALQYCTEEYIKLLDSHPLMRFDSDADISGEGARVTAGLRLFGAILGYIEYLNFYNEEAGPQLNFWQYAVTREGDEKINPATSFRESLGLSIKKTEIDSFSNEFGDNLSYISQYLLPMALTALIELSNEEQKPYPYQIANALHLVFDLLYEKEPALIRPVFEEVMVKLQESYNLGEFQAKEIIGSTVNLLCLRNHLLENYLRDEAQASKTL